MEVLEIITGMEEQTTSVEEVEMIMVEGVTMVEEVMTMEVEMIMVEEEMTMVVEAMIMEEGTIMVEVEMIVGVVEDMIDYKGERNFIFQKSNILNLTY